ncbi:MAG: type IX secretion system membrane protein PorP/SprF, partial [Pseudarcicella sp.]|nr:type IX secretion system membrane protein PorP/SprF [Pseudarcicella sp.]
FYAAPLYLNPAFTGSAMSTRLNLNYRNQWAAIGANYVTSSLSADTYIDQINSGVGVLFTNDKQFSDLTTTSISGLYAYHLKLSESLSANLGMQASYVNRSISLDGKIFGDQLNNFLATDKFSKTNDPLGQSLNPSFSYVNFSGGGIVYSDKFWFGVSAHNINQPNQAFSKAVDAKLPMRLGVQGGYRIALADYSLGNGVRGNAEREKSLTPAFMYKRQGPYEQLDLGMYLTYSPMVLGAWYRGIPLKTYQKIPLQDAAIFLLGYKMDNFSMGYSYDLTVSTLGASSGGSHEVSLSYTFDNYLEKKPNRRRRKKEMSCPKF